MGKQKVFVTCIQNLLSIPNLVRRMGYNQKARFLITNKYSSNLKKHEQLLQELDAFDHIQVIPNYYSALSCLQDKNSNHPILLVGDPHHQLYDEIKNFKIVTVQQICSIIPEKVPLSYRSPPCSKIREKVEKRIGHKFNREPNIKNVLVTSHNIKMWDEAIQVILDLQPATVIVEYEQQIKKGQRFELSNEDFIDALETCHKVIYSNPLPRLIDYNKNCKHLLWIINSRSLDSSLNLIIDEDLLQDDQDFVGLKFQTCKIIEEELM